MEDKNNKKYFYINCIMTVTRLRCGMAFTLMHFVKYESLWT